MARKSASSPSSIDFLLIYHGSRSSGNTLAAYRAAAVNAGNGVKPANIQGGIFTTSSNGGSSSTVSASASATAKSEGLFTAQVPFASILFGATAVLVLIF
jgi:hypothetical protein